MGNQNSRNKREHFTLKQNQENEEIATSDNFSSTSPGAAGERTQLESIQKLAKILMERTQKQQSGLKGISEEIFIINIFPKYPDLGHRLYNYFKQEADCLSESGFKLQCEKYLGILLDDHKILEFYIKLFTCKDIENLETLNKDELTKLLEICFAIAISNYSGQRTKSCPKADVTISSIVDSIFYSHEHLTVGYIVNWFELNALRLIIHMHSYIVHIFTTAYRILEYTNEPEINTTITNVIGNEEKIIVNSELMPISRAWLLAGSLPYNTYSKLQIETIKPPGDLLEISAPTTTPVFKEKLSLIPSHWTLLYDSFEHGIGTNRFLHHVLGYRGATLIILKAREDDQTYCIASPAEWKESNLYTGLADSCILALYPRFSILEKRANILYLNTSIRGYPKGLRAGSDPKNPIICIDETFEKLQYKGNSQELLKIEVWGCGDKSSRERQLDIKKWQIKEAERQRTVKLTAADWMDHPDRYLLELGGRKNYNN